MNAKILVTTRGHVKAMASERQLLWKQRYALHNDKPLHADTCMTSARPLIMGGEQSSV